MDKAAQRRVKVANVGIRLHYLLYGSQLLDALIEVIEDLDSDMEQLLLISLKEDENG